MKQLFLTFAISLFVIASLRAQDDEGGMLPNSGVAVEFNAAPFSAAPINLNNLKVRYFMGSNMVARVGFNLGMDNSKNEIIDATTGDVTSETLNKEFSVSLSPGVEMHYPATDRLSPFIGGEVIFGMVREKSETITTAAGTTTTTTTVKAPGSSNTLGLNLITGADFYIVKNLYLGVEAGYGLQYVSFPQSETTTGNTTTDGTSKSNNFDLGTNFNARFRLGYVFNY